MTLNCETGEFGFVLQFCLTCYAISFAIPSPSVSSIPFLSSGDLQKLWTSSHSGHIYAKIRRLMGGEGVNENIPRLALLSLPCSTDFNCPSKYPLCLSDLHPVL